MKYLFILGWIFLTLSACSKNSDPGQERSFRMGFANSAPRPDFNAFMRSLQNWSTRSDAAIISTEVPWDSLLSGETIDEYILHNYAYLVRFYRQKSFPVWVYIDPENGLDRRIDAQGLIKRGKSIADQDMQDLYSQFVVHMDSLLQPDHLGLALETNLIRGTATSSVYNGVIQAATAAAIAVRRFDGNVKLSVSVQVDYAWGKMTGQPYQGIEQDLLDFPFLQELGLSSYPYFNFTSPDSIPADYYSRLVEGKNLPVMVTESGWSSAVSASGQEEYIKRHSVLLNHAKAMAWFQLTFTDIDIAALPPSTPENLKDFAFIGLVDISFQPKPALKDWDAVYYWPIIK